MSTEGLSDIKVGNGTLADGVWTLDIDENGRAGFGHVFNLKPELAEMVKESFMSFQWDKPDGSPTSLKVEFSSSNENQFIPITYQEHWNVIRKIDAANNVSYACK